MLRTQWATNTNSTFITHLYDAYKSCEHLLICSFKRSYIDCVILFLKSLMKRAWDIKPAPKLGKSNQACYDATISHEKILHLYLALNFEAFVHRYSTKQLSEIRMLRIDQPRPWAIPSSSFLPFSYSEKKHWRQGWELISGELWVNSPFYTLRKKTLFSRGREV